MNPPPYRPPQDDKNKSGRRALLAILIAAPMAVATIFGVIHAINSQRKDRAAWQDMESSRHQVDDNLKKNFNPKTGMTNVDAIQLDKLRDSLKNIAQNSTGDEAVLAGSLSKFADRMQAAGKNYHAAVTKLRAARVLDGFDTSNKGQLAERRELVHQFLEANAASEQIITNAEDQMRADLVEAHVRPSKIDSLLANYHAGTGVQNAMTMKVRQCDDRVGAALLDALNTLETNWGHWKYDPPFPWDPV
jgi:hypothetical protein